jgi:penicillin-binding protein 2
MIKHRVAALMCFFLFLFLFLSAVLGYYQLIKGPSLAREAAAMRNQQIAIKEFNRGEIYDRNHLLLTGNTSSTALYCLPREIQLRGSQYSREDESLSEAAETLAGCLKSLSSQDIYLALKEARDNGKGIIRLAAELDPEEVQAVNDSGLNGVIAAPLLKRYRDDGFLSHVLGYVGKGADNSGKAGLEKMYDQVLKGNTSSQQIVSVQDARGISIQGLMFRIRQEQSQDRSCLVLTIDSRVQEVVEKVMNDQIVKGAVVVMDIKSKEVLALASRPTFSPYADMEQLIKNDQDSILINRALSRYHPGSIFKILVAAAALEEEVVKWQDRFSCTGAYEFTEDLSISCWKSEGHGQVTFPQAFANSCNPAFIDIALKLNRSRLMEYVDKFHITDESLIGYSSDQDYSYVKVEPVSAALANACLGQQGVMLTPLQIASLIATIADDGQWAPPSLLRYWINGEGVKTSLEPATKEQVISVETARMLQKLMELTVEEGTGKNAALSLAQVAGKTATSQVGIEKYGDKEREILNTWFAGYLPASNPRWAVVVLVEDGTSGAADAAPVFKAIAQGLLNL